MNDTRFQSGISLVEILVALVISLFLLGGIVQVYLGNKTTYRFTNALSEVQENGRFALETISRDLRQVGYWGCISLGTGKFDNVTNRLVTWGNYDSDLHNFEDENAIEGTNDDVNGSDTLTIRGSKQGLSTITSPFAETTDRFININSSRHFENDDIILIMRCGANDEKGGVAGKLPPEADIVHVSGVSTPTANQLRLQHETNLSQKYENDAIVIELQTVTYSIGPDEDGSGESALFRSEFGENEQLIEGIQEMQILYGIDSDADNYANQYVDSDQVVDFDDVVSIRIMLLVTSIDQFVTETPQTYTFNGAADITALDRRFYQSFTNTIALRNRAGFNDK